jgi:hypothetical protein
MKTIHLIAIGLSAAAIASGIFIFQTYNHAAKAGATENQKEQNLGSNTQQNHQNTGQEAVGGDNGNDFGD